MSKQTNSKSVHDLHDSSQIGRTQAMPIAQSAKNLGLFSSFASPTKPLQKGTNESAIHHSPAPPAGSPPKRLSRPRFKQKFKPQDSTQISTPQRHTVKTVNKPIPRVRSTSAHSPTSSAGRLRASMLSPKRFGPVESSSHFIASPLPSIKSRGFRPRTNDAPEATHMPSLSPKSPTSLLSPTMEGVNLEILENMADPVIFIPFNTKPGEVPRAIALERKKRYLAKMKLSECFQNEGLLPTGDPMFELDEKTSAYGASQTNFAKFLPLEAFDVAREECRNPSSWMSYSRNWELPPPPSKRQPMTPGQLPSPSQKPKTVKALFGQARRNDEWVNSAILGYREKDSRWLVVFLDTNERAWLARIHIYIWGEDPTKFARRVRAAHEFRALVEASIRYSLYVDSMPHEGLLPLPQIVKQRIENLSVPIRPKVDFTLVPNLSKAKTEAAIIIARTTFPHLIEEAEVFHMTTNNQILFDSHLQNDPELVQELKLERFIEHRSEQFDHEFGIKSLPQVNYDSPDSFRRSQKAFEFASILASPEAVKALQHVTEECWKMTVQDKETSIPHHCIYHVVPLAKTPTAPMDVKAVSLSDFKQLQNAARQQVRSYINDNWTVFLKTGIQRHFSGFHKGWFNLAERNRDVYEVSKLKRFLTRIYLTMASTLRTLVTFSIEKFTDYLSPGLNWKLDVISPSVVLCSHPDNAQSWAGLDGQGDNHVLCIKRGPVFTIELGVDDAIATKSDITYLGQLISEFESAEEAQREFQNELGESDEDDSEPEVMTARPVKTPSRPTTALQPMEDEEEKEENKLVPTVLYNTIPSEYITASLQAFQDGIRSLEGIGSLEPQLVPNLLWPSVPEIVVPNLEEKWIVEAKQQIKKSLEMCLTHLEAYRQTFDRYRLLTLLDLDKWANVIRFRASLGLHQKESSSGTKREAEEKGSHWKDFLAEYKQGKDSSLNEFSKPEPLFCDDLTALHRQMQNESIRILHEIPERVHVGMFLVRNNTVRNFLSNKRKKMAEKVCDIIREIAESRANNVMDEYGDIVFKLRRKNKEIEDVVEIENFIEALPQTIDSLKENIQTCQRFYNTLDKLSVSLSNEAFKLRWKTFGCIKTLNEQIEQSREMLEADRLKFRDAQVKSQTTFAKSIEHVARQVTTFAQRHTDFDDISGTADEAEQLWRQLRRMDEQSKVFNRRETVMEMPFTNYENITRLIKDFEPIYNLWKATDQWETNSDSWMNGEFKKINPEVVEQIVGESFRSINKSMRVFKRQPQLLDLATKIRDRISEFKRYVPLLIAMCNPGIRLCHWKDISDALKIDLYPTGHRPNESEEEEEEESELSDDVNFDEDGNYIGYTFKQAIEEELFQPKYLKKIQHFSDIASKEYSIEQALQLIKDAWKSTEFVIVPYGETGSYVLRESDEVIQQIDDHSVMVQGMSFSAFKKRFEKKIAKWEMKLNRSSEIIEEWIQVQQGWLYLEPIFSSEDIQKQLPAEAKNFRTVDHTWRKIMEQAARTPLVMKFCAMDKLLSKLRESHRLLDVVQKGLADYIDTKRQAFPRFYFLSADELLEILSQTRDPTAVQPFFRSCFENIAKIEFVGEQNEMVSMFSLEGERVEFIEPMLPEGNVEQWMKKLEKLMIKTVHQRTNNGFQDYIDSPRTEWALNHCAQVIIAVSQIFYAIEVEKAIQKGGVEELKNLYGVLGKQLEDLTDLVGKGLNRLDSKTMSALLTIEVHSRDVLQRLIDDGVSAVGDFGWMSQLRYYLDMESSGDRRVVVRQVQTVWNYGYEYLGNTSRLVITPLTDRIYMTLMGALHLNLGGAPAGPAGTGKTETVKDLGKALAMPVIVFNCSEGLDYLSMGRFFTGLAMCGAWSCFDEFNRIDIEVLSVIAQQILTIQQAIISGVERFVFEGREIALKPTCAVFITMNPGYAGRTELPDNLKALFRPVACFTPDTPITLASGLSRRICNFKESETLVDSMSTSLSGIISSNVTHFLPQGKRKTMIIEFIDGRKLTCTPDHRFLVELPTGERVWKQAKDITVYKEFCHSAQDSLASLERVLFGIDSPLDMDSCPRGNTIFYSKIGSFDINNPKLRDLSFAIVYILAFSYVKHHLDDNFSAIEAPAFQQYRDMLPENLVLSLMNVGTIPHELLSDLCPMAIRREYIATILGLSAFFDFYNSKIPQIVLPTFSQSDKESIAQWIEKISGHKPLLGEKNLIIRDEDAILSFASMIGVRFSPSKAATLSQFSAFTKSKLAGRISNKIASSNFCPLSHSYNTGYNGFAMPIISRTEGSVADVFDLSVKHTHNFLANGAVAHNCMIPDYALIAEIRLFSFGFRSARELAQKTTSAFRLSSEQLSSQYHYDFGMRALNTTLVAAGNRKRENPTQQESLILLRALKEVNTPKFLENDVVLFENIISDMFPGIKPPKVDHGRLELELKNSALRLGYQPGSLFIHKCIELYQTIELRHGLMTVGPTIGGKTAALYTLQGALNVLGNEEAAYRKKMIQQGRENELPEMCTFMPAIITRLNPKAITMGQLYGQFDLQTHEWTDGILANIVRKAVQNTKPVYRWTIFDGPVDALWIENMNTVLDDNKKLCLTSGEIIALTPGMNMIFEVQDLAVASPATVSRCGMVYFEPENIVLADMMVASWLEKLPDQLKYVEAPAPDPEMVPMTPLSPKPKSSPFSSRPGSRATHTTSEEIAESTPQKARKHSETFVRLQNMFDEILVSALEFMRQECKEYMPTVDRGLILSFFRLLDSYMNDFKPDDMGVVPPERELLLGTLLEPLFFFALIWSIGATITVEYRDRFNTFLKEKISSGGFLSELPIPDDMSVYDICLSYQFADYSELVGDDGSQPSPSVVLEHSVVAWLPWIKTIPSFSIPSTAQFTEILVPTVDTICAKHIINRLIEGGQSVLAIGPTGTSKSATINQYLMEDCNSDLFLPVNFSFSAQTSANQLQDYVDEKIEKKRKGVFGPPAGKKYLLFVDDTNMPALEKYGAQPPVELLRQFLDHDGWYDRKTLQFRKIVDTQLVCAMGPPGGGRNPVSDRFLRFFNQIAFPEMQNSSLSMIFTTIVDWWFQNSFGVTSSPIVALKSAVVESSIEIFNSIRKELLPTPAKSHYTFNLRDLSKVFQGIMTVDHNSLVSTDHFARLWVHECYRVFADRLINNEDRSWFKENIDSKLQRFWSTSFDAIIHSREQSAAIYVKRFTITNQEDESPSKDADSGLEDTIVFGDFMFPDAETRKYAEIMSLYPLKHVINDYLEQYNSQSKQPMNLVMFLNAIQHVSKILRILRQPGGNALLLGVGGSGRQSLTRLAVFIAEYDLFQIEITKSYGIREWREDLKRVLLKAGQENKPIVFLFNDKQLINESMLEDINTILNTGDIPNLYDPQELENIYSTMRPVCQAKGLSLTKMSFFHQYLIRVKANIHIVIAMSPIGKAFRERLRMFPSLVNCCTIDWFTEWPDEALRSVAQEALAEMESLGETKNSTEKTEIINRIVNVCVVLHQSVFNYAEKFRKEMRRVAHITPTTYLELLSSFSKQFTELRENVSLNKLRLETGLEKLEATREQVQEMSVELETMKPILIKTTQEVEIMMEQITKDKAQAAQTRAVVQKEEEVASEKAKECEEIKLDAERDLAEALPALEVAHKALKALKRNDITELGGYTNPPFGVRLVMEAVCIMFEMKPKMVDDPKTPGAKVEDFWAPSKSLLSDPTRLLDRLFTFKKDNIKPSVIKKVQKYVKNTEQFTPKVMERVSRAASGLCAWVLAMDKYHHVALSVAPKRERLANAEEVYKETMENLEETKARLKEVEDKLQTLETQFAENVAKKEELSQRVEECEGRMDRAGRLLGGLGGERTRWQSSLKEWDIRFENIIGDALLASGSIAYLGVFTSDFREDLCRQWANVLDENDLKFTPFINSEDNSYISPTVSILSDPVVVRQWTLQSLPSDSHSIENAVILHCSSRWPLMIDPQEQATKWVKKMEWEHGIDVVKASDKDLLRTLENDIRFGKSVLLVGVGEELDPALEPILLRQTFKQSGTEVIAIGDQTIPYNPSFKMYLSTSLPNPNFAPEIMARVQVLNFAITETGLEDQLLGIVVQKERPDLEEQKNRLVESNARMKSELKDIENKILSMLAEATGNILDDEELISTLSESKEKSTEIAEKVLVAEETEQQIDITREKYRSVAIRASTLFFCLTDFSVADSMYQYSLQWFVSIFSSAIDSAEESENLVTRLENLNSHFTYQLYLTVCRSLFEEHKLIFSFLLTLRIALKAKRINADELRFFMMGTSDSDTDRPNPCSDWLSKKAWVEILALDRLSETYQGISNTFETPAGAMVWRALYDSPEPHRMPFPAPFETSVVGFQRFLPLKIVRSDKVIDMAMDFVSSELGPKFIEPPTFNLSLSYQGSSSTTPLVFVLSQGADPTTDLQRFAEEMRMSKKMSSISLGQGQGERAEKMISLGAERGTWVLLANCHLAVSWMPKLEQIVESLQSDPSAVHRDFRLWLTSMPSADFPVSILQNSAKMTNEPPKGLRANLLRTYAGFDNTFLDETVPSKQSAFKSLLYSLSSFHAVIQERRRFGPLGFNIPYEFTMGDLDVCVKQLALLLNTYEMIPFDVIRFLVGMINYGGRVTDHHDHHTLSTILEDYILEKSLEDNYRFSTDEHFCNPPVGDHADYLSFIKQLPLQPSPIVFGFHTNAEITSANQETDALCDMLILTQARASADTGDSWESIVDGIASNLMERCPQSFDLVSVSKTYQTNYKESMNTVLVQECERYNRLLDVIRASLKELRKALKGIVVMSSELDKVANSLFANRVPTLWENKAYPSLKPLSTWFIDLTDRTRFVQNWIDNGTPNAFWISGFFFPQAFLTGTLQNFARRQHLPIDTLSFSFTVLDEHSLDKVSDLEAPEHGVLIYGLFLEGARWDWTSHHLTTSRPKELYTPVPVIHLLPEQHRAEIEDGSVYHCPVYKTLRRAGVLTTTGHSSNFIIMLDLPTKSAPGVWTKAGVAMFSTLAD